MSKDLPGRDVAAIFLPLDVDAPSVARRAVAETLRAHPRAADAILATSEIVTNAVRHAGADRARLTVALTDGRVRVSVQHPGERIFPPRSVGHDRPGGYGLSIVSAIVDDWGVETGSETVVWFEIGSPNDHH